MNDILHFFDIHLSSYHDFVRLKKQQKKSRKNMQKMKQKNRLYRDILRGLKKNELMLLHANVKRIEQIIESFVVLENIFVPF